MRIIGAFEAKTHFSQLLVEVANGEKIIITKHGQQVAILSPIIPSAANENVSAQAIQRIRNLRKGVTLGKNLSIKALREEGRK